MELPTQKTKVIDRTCDRAASRGVLVPSHARCSDVEKRVNAQAAAGRAERTDEYDRAQIYRVANMRRPEQGENLVPLNDDAQRPSRHLSQRVCGNAAETLRRAADGGGPKIPRVRRRRWRARMRGASRPPRRSLGRYAANAGTITPYSTTTRSPLSVHVRVDLTWTACRCYCRNQRSSSPL